MNLLSATLLALAMSTDAFAAAIGKGAALQKPRWSEALRTGAIFGAIEMLTPLVGWSLGQFAASAVQNWDHWIAFALLGALGLHMVHAGLNKDGGNDGSRDPDDTPPARPQRHSFARLAVTGFATSIDAMAVGVGLAFVDVPILPMAAGIGCATLVMVTLGVMLGRVLGRVAGQRAEVLGGLVLIGVGSVILYEHLSAV